LLVERVEAFDLEYYNLVKADGPGRTWKNAGAVVTGFPARVDIRLAFLSESGAGEIRRTILLPTKVRR